MSGLRARLAGVSYARTAFLLLIILALIAAVRGPNLFTSSGMGGAIASAAPLILAAMAITPIVMSGRGDVNLAIGPLIGFVNVVLIQFLINKGYDAPMKLILGALVIGIVVQTALGLIGVVL